MSKKKRKSRPGGFISLPSHRPKSDSRICRNSKVRWRRREFPGTPDGTTAGDRAGWIAIYEAWVIVRGTHIPTVEVCKQVSIEAGRLFDHNVGDKAFAMIYNLELIK